MTSAGTYSDFLTALGQYESGNNYQFVSSLGYLGRYQFSEEALSAIGFYTPDGSGSPTDFVGAFTPAAAALGVTDKASFLQSPAAQDSAVQAWFSRVVADEHQLGLDNYIGQTVGGIEITPSGLIAGAHLVGAWNLRAFLESNGQVDPQDGYGTTVANYLARFAGYDVPFSFSAPATAGEAPASDSAVAAPDPAPAEGAVADAAASEAAAAVSIAGGSHAPEGGEFVFTVTRSGDASGTSMVDYYAWSEQAAINDLSGPTAGTAYFLPGDSSAQIRIAAAGDVQAQGEEPFHVALSNARGAAITVGQADGWIDA